MNNPAVTIIMITFNHADTCSDTIESILAQSCKDWKLYCLDDCSTDNTFDVLKKYRDLYPTKIRLLQPPKNLGSVYKQLLVHKFKVTTPYWCYIEGDDFWCDPQKLDKQINILEKNPITVACATSTRMIDGQGKELGIISPHKDRWNYADLVFKANVYSFYVHISSIMYRNMPVDSPTFHPKSYHRMKQRGEVALHHAILRSTGMDCIHIPDISSVYRITGKGIWTSLSEEEKLKRNKELSQALQDLRPWNYKLQQFINTVFPRRKSYRLLKRPPINLG